MENYKVKVVCANCDYEGVIEVALCVKVSDTRCPKCKCDYVLSVVRTQKETK